jgi:cell division protein FtsW
MLLISAGALTILGLIMVFSASSIHSIDTKGSAISFLLRQLLFVAISIPLAGYLSKLSIGRWELVGRFGLLISIALLAVLLIPGVGKTVNGIPTGSTLNSSIFNPANLQSSL